MLKPSNLPMVLFLLGLLLCQAAGCGSPAPGPMENEPGAADRDDTADATAAVKNPRDIPLVPDQSARITVFSNPAGCLVFVDLVPVRNDTDGLALTPCEFTIPRGKHSISVERPGGKRATQHLEIQEDRELEFDVTATPSELDDQSLLNAPLFEAAVGRAIPLESLNSPGQELDPFLTPDGLTLYFASDRGGVRGVYVSTRPTPYHDFNEPRIITASSGSDLPTSPSVSADGLSLVYGVADKSRLWQLNRTSPEAPFDGKEIIRSDERPERIWRAAQLSGDGLRLYWSEEGSDATVTRAAVRPARGKLFGKTLAFELPGRHPHLSADGLRQFSFDGATLHRARRGSLKQPFGPPEVVAELELEPYKPSTRHRQFWVTDDEQWLYFCDDPSAAGDLFVVRISDGPGWGRSFVGKPVANKMTVADAAPGDQPKPDPTPKDSVELRSGPLPYTTHWEKLVALLQANQGAQAVTLVKQALQQKELQNDKELLAWDLELAEAIAEFDGDVRNGLRQLKPGDAIRINGSRFDFDRADGDTLQVKLKDKELTRTLQDLTPGERVSLADAGPDRADAAKALRFAIFLHFQDSLLQTVADGWFKRTGEAGVQFHERLGLRMLHQSKAELARGNVAAGIGFLDAVDAAAGPKSAAAGLAAKQRETLYESVRWNPRGSRTWKRGELGEFIADFTRSNGSYLMSDRQYGDFELTCEWMVTEPNSMGGVYLRYSGQGQPLENGAKIHLANDPDLRRMDRFATGSLFAVTAPELNASRPAGQWNTLRIQARDTAVQVWINDKEVLQTSLAKEVPVTGYVMLDGVTGGIRYRKVLLFDLGPSQPPQ